MAHPQSMANTPITPSLLAQAGSVIEPQSNNTEPDLDIRAEFERVLATKLGFVGAYSFNKTCPNAPNPSLQIEGLGMVGVPLSTREAEVIKSHAEQAPFGMGERTVIDKGVRDTWEIDAKKVAFANPQWAVFLDNTVKEVCQVLSVNYDASRPRCEPYKLLLYETGSHFLPHVDTEKQDGMFATIIVVLPSEFTGGEAHLSHGGVSMVYDCSATSLNTTVMAWYTDVTHEIKPIKSGYRLALSYNLIHTTTSLRPAVSTNSGFVEEVLRILHAWSRSTAPDVPEKLVCLLDHKYSLANRRGSALKGVDDVRVALLQQVAEQVDFSLGLATIVCSLQGCADDDGQYDWGYHDSDASDSDVDVRFAEIESCTLTIEDFVDLEGVKVSDNLEVDEETEIIPADLTEVIDNGSYDDQEYEGYMGNGAGSLERWYRRTVLVVWPNQNNLKIVYGRKGLKNACIQLESDAASSPGPTEDALGLIKFVLSRAGDSSPLVIPTVCRAAISWKNWTLWNNTLKDLFWRKDQPLLENSDLSNALRTFGFKSIRETFEHALRASPNNKSRIQFLSVIESLLEQVEESEKSLVPPWLDQEKADMFRNLKNIETDEAKLIVSSSLSYGGASFLAECVAPQFLDHAKPTPLFIFAITVFKLLDHEPSTKSSLVSKSVMAAISKVNFFKPKPTTLDRYHYWQSTGLSETSDPNSKTLKTCLKHCLTVQYPEAITLILEKAKQTTGMPAAHVQDRVKDVMLPLLSFVIDLRSKNPNAFPLVAVKTLAQTTITAFLESVGSAGREITVPVMRSLARAAFIDGGAEVIATSIMPHVLTPEVSVDVALALAEEIHANTSSLTVDSEYHGPDAQFMVTTLTNKFADGVILGTSEAITSALDRCLKLKALGACMKVIQRLITISRQATPRSLETILISVVPSLREFTRSHSGLASDTNDLLQVVFTRWATVVLGPKPAQNPSAFAFLNSWACTCWACQRVKDFLGKPFVERLSLSLDCIGAPTRKHVETFLYGRATSVITYTTIRSSPQGLQMVFTDAMKASISWEANQKKGLETLRGISTDENKLKRILGAHYQTMLQALGVDRVNKTSKATSSSAATRPTAAQPTRGEPSVKKRKRVPSPADIIDLT